MFTRTPRWCLWAALAVLCLFAAKTNFAQTTFGSIVGTVTDPSGAPVAEAQVTLTNAGTSEKRPATTNNEGLFQYVNLPPGQYKVDVERTGFKKSSRTDVTVATASTIRVDFALEVGALDQTVEVTSQSPLLQPETSSLGTVVDQREATELPLNGRNPMSLVALAPSVVPQGQAQSNPNGTNPFAWGNYQIGGGQANQSTMWLDGSPVNAAYINLTALIPTQDSLQEFKVQTSSLPPEYGRFAGGVVNFTTKSGTNQLHGNAWEYLRNRELDANTFFNNTNGTGRPSFTQNQFGVNLGGPVYIPKIYDGRNKTFFFFDYEGFRQRQGTSYTETVPTAAERTGNLSSLGATLYDPLTTCNGSAASPVAGYRPCAAGEAQYSRTPFAGGIIPQNRLNATSLLLLNRLYPLPNAPGVNGVGNYVANGSGGGTNNETVVHIDQNVSDKQHISARYTYWGNLNLPTDPFGNGVCQDRCQEYFNTNNFVFSDTYSFNPTTILEFRASYQRFIYDRTPETLGLDLTTLGFPASMNDQVLYRDLPLAVISGFDTAGTFGSQGAGSIITARNDNDRVAGTLTKILGNHQLQFGGEWLRMTDNYLQTNIPSGTFSFDGGFTAANGQNTGAGGGAGLASYLLGYPASGTVGYPALVAGQQLYPAVFFNDNWHASSKLTINMGLRWEHSGPWTERYDRLSFFDQTLPNPITPQYNGAIELVNGQYDPYRSSINPNWMQFSPRIGVAYQIEHNTVFHAGYGIFFLPNDVNQDYAPNSDPINSYNNNYNASVLTGLPAGNLSNPFPGGIVQYPGRNANYQNVLLGQSNNFSQLGNPYAYMQQYNADIQHQFGQSFLLDVAYAGSKGTHLPLPSPDINQLPDQYLSLGNQLTQNVPNPLFGLVNGGSLSGATTTYSQLLRPFPQYGNLGFAGEGVGTSNYNSLQVQAIKRFSGGNQISVAYTHSKLISNADTVTNWLEAGGGTTYQDWNNIRGETSLASFDTPDRLIVSYVLDVPVGKGRKFMANANGLVQSTLGGWGIQGTTTLQSGFPLHFSTSVNQINAPGSGGSRPNVVAGCDASTSGSATSRLAEYFNTSCFSQPAPFTFGDEPRVDPNLRTFGVANWDFAAVKNFPFGNDGKYKFTFRAEFFNIFNRTQFGYPGQTFGNSNFGQVTSQVNQPRLIQFALRFGF
jgi:hypothetical protein